MKIERMQIHLFSDIPLRKNSSKGVGGVYRIYIASMIEEWIYTLINLAPACMRKLLAFNNRQPQFPHTEQNDLQDCFSEKNNNILSTPKRSQTYDLQLIIFSNKQNDFSRRSMLGMR